MSDIIRSCRHSWMPPPGRAVDVRVSRTPDTYSFLQNQIESEQRVNQNNVNRTLRGSNINAAPRARSTPRQSYPLFPTTIITLPIR